MQKVIKIEEQLRELIALGLEVRDKNKAMEYLLDIGYYRLGFYCFPFREKRRGLGGNAHFECGASLENAVELYYFDVDLRNLLLRYLSRVEVHFRTRVIYSVSNKYPDDPFWHVSPNVLRKDCLVQREYKNALRYSGKEDYIKADLRKHRRLYSPAWKQLEAMPFGAILLIYEHLLDAHLKLEIAQQLGARNSKELLNHLHTLRRLRNVCAHNKVLFDWRLSQSIISGNIVLPSVLKNSLSGACLVLYFYLERISTNRAEELKTQLKSLLNRISSPRVRQIIVENSRLGGEECIFREKSL